MLKVDCRFLIEGGGSAREKMEQNVQGFQEILCFFALFLHPSIAERNFNAYAFYHPIGWPFSKRSIAAKSLCDGKIAKYFKKQTIIPEHPVKEHFDLSR